LASACAMARAVPSKLPRQRKALNWVKGHSYPASAASVSRSNWRTEAIVSRLRLRFSSHWFWRGPCTLANGSAGPERRSMAVALARIGEVATLPTCLANDRVALPLDLAEPRVPGCLADIIQGRQRPPALALSAADAPECSSDIGRERLPQWQPWQWMLWSPHRQAQFGWKPRREAAEGRRHDSLGG